MEEVFDKSYGKYVSINFNNLSILSFILCQTKIDGATKMNFYTHETEFMLENFLFIFQNIETHFNYDFSIS